MEAEKTIKPGYLGDVWQAQYSFKYRNVQFNEYIFNQWTSKWFSIGLSMRERKTMGKFFSKKKTFPFFFSRPHLTHHSIFHSGSSHCVVWRWWWLWLELWINVTHNIFLCSCAVKETSEQQNWWKKLCEGFPGLTNYDDEGWKRRRYCGRIFRQTQNDRERERKDKQYRSSSSRDDEWDIFFDWFVLLVMLSDAADEWNWKNKEASTLGERLDEYSKHISIRANRSTWHWTWIRVCCCRIRRTNGLTWHSSLSRSQSNWCQRHVWSRNESHRDTVIKTHRKCK